MGLAFGTSGIRGLVAEFTQEECAHYVAAFVDYLKLKNISFHKIVLAIDLRESSPTIQQMLARALATFRIQLLDLGPVPTPVLAWACSELGLPGIMITGSHIPADRNGFKFYLAEGEILKEDEKIIFENYSKIKSGKDRLKIDAEMGIQLATYDGTSAYLRRYTSVLPRDALASYRLGFYQHSSVARDIFVQLLRDLGADVLAFGRESEFVPVDTEAVSSVDFLREKLISENLDAIISTDGDADRPLVMSDDGKIVPGELLGLITSRELSIDTIVCPVSCSSLIERSNWIPHCERTQIGSPFVLGKINELKKAQPDKTIAGFEANGGYILSSSAKGFAALNTRDSLLPILQVLIAAQKFGRKISTLLSVLPLRVNISGLIRNFDREKSSKVLTRIESILSGDKVFKGCEILGQVTQVDQMDGARMTFSEGSIVHLRPSGNAPEFRIYIEAASASEAQVAMNLIEKWVLA